jgi:Secretion system C-terminal sorting domain
MKKNLINLKYTILLISSVCIMKSTFAQSPSTLELTRSGGGITTGPSTTPIVGTFLNDALNADINTVYSPYAPSLTATVSYRNQLRSTTLTGTSTVVNGMLFGARLSDEISATGPQVVGSTKLYNFFGAAIPAGRPTNAMFLSSPTFPAANSPIVGPSGSPNGLDRSIDAENNSLATGPLGNDGNYGFALFNTVEPLYDANLAKDGRYEFGELVIRFNRPVVNPVIHLAGMGGSYSFQPILPVNAPRQISYFTTELELQTSGLTSTLRAGNSNINLSGNNILNSSTTPNAGCYEDGSTTNGFSNYGAASGSVRINGTVTELVYKVFVRGAAASNFNFSKVQADITSASRDPFNGDLYYLSISLDKPTQQISGNIFIDRDGLTNNNINTSVGVDNPKTNLGGSLFANLLNTLGQVVASIPVSNDGAYLFDNVPVGTYSVQLTTNASSGTYASPVAAPATVLPTGYANTGEFVGNTAGSDGTVNGKSSSVVVNASDIKVEVNFGVERLPESISYVTFIAKPLLNAVITLNGTMPVLSGSDPEDQPVPGSLSGKSLRIDTLPNNATLIYAGATVFQGQVILNYNPALLQVKFTDPGAGLTGIVVFSYSYIDAAGLADPTPATYTIRWPDLGILPIVLSDFTGVKNNCNADLNWKTSSELDSDKFEVEFSTTTNTTFKAIGTIGASGNSTITKSYQFNYFMESGVNYYFRLKMYKKDGTFTYSQIIALSCIDTKAPVAIIPNPSNTGAFRITGMAKGKNTVSIYSNDGKLIKTENVLNNKNIAITDLAAGTYIVRILNENGTASVERLVKY